MTERDLQKSIVAAARALGWNVSVSSTDRQERKQHRSLPDLYMTHPGFKRALWLEVKAPGKRPRPDQESWLEQTRNAGQEATWTDNLDDALLLLSRRES